MKKFVSTIAALAVVTAMAVPAMAATNDDVMAAVKAAGATAEQQTAAQTYLNTVKLGEATLDTVVAEVNKGAANKAAGNWTATQTNAEAAIAAINKDPAAANYQVELKITSFGDVQTIAIVSPIATAGADVNVKTNQVAGVNQLNGTQNSGVVGGGNGGSTGVIKGTGASMNMTAAISAALAMAASMGAAVVYGVKKGLLAK